MKIKAFTNIGTVRTINEDRYLSEKLLDGSHLLAVCDGMGGEAAGDVAADMAIKTLKNFVQDPPTDELTLAETLKNIHESIKAEAKENRARRGMGSTATVALIREKTVYWAHAGDSRLYLFREGALRCITDDHNVPGILLKKGEITPEEARNHPMGGMLLNHLGGRTLKPDTGKFECHPEDILLLSSDGLHGDVMEDIMVGILSTEKALDEKLNQLVEAALETGGRDNITIIGAQI